MLGVALKIIPRMKPIVFLIFTTNLFVHIAAYEILSEYHQNDYDVKLERCVLVWANQTVYRDLKADFVPFNRTQRAFNFSTFIDKDLTKDITVHVQFYKFLSNEYRFFPLTVGVDACEHFDKNSFQVADLLRNHSNASSCPWKKGFYYGYNILPDFSKLPPYIPRGSYKLEIKANHMSYPSIHAEVFAQILDKPLAWN